jgi:hypothetical protein
MRVPLLVLLAACASAPSAPGARGVGDVCRGHGDCAPGLVCVEASGTCAADECDGDDCDRSRVGEARCETVESITYAKTCTYDGVRCLEWLPVACEAGETCSTGPRGAECLPAGSPAE